jgi:membrane associated rhomboid family serine protease
MLCPGCGKLISIDEEKCPYCGLLRPGSWWKNNPVFRWMSDGDGLIRGIIYANVAMFVVSLLLNSRMPGLSMNPFLMLSPENRSLFFLGATGSVSIETYHRYWTLISANYLHGSLLHILFNMIALRQIGGLAVREYGASRMITVYTLGGAVGFWISYRAGVILTIGASAAVCALIGSVIYYGFSRGGVYGKLIYTRIGGWAVFILLFGLLVPGINNWGHGGGFLAGMALGYFLGYHEKQKEKHFHKMLGAACIGLTGVILIWAVASGIYYRMIS